MLRLEAGNDPGVQATGMMENAAWTDAAAAGRVVSGTTTVETAGPDPGTDTVTDRTGPRPGAQLGKTAAKMEGAAGMEEAMEAPVADTEDTTAVAMAATTPQPNVAVATTEEVAWVDDTAAAPAEVATAISKSSILNPATHYAHRNCEFCLILLIGNCIASIRKGKMSHLYIIPV